VVRVALQHAQHVAPLLVAQPRQQRRLHTTLRFSGQLGGARSMERRRGAIAHCAHTDVERVEQRAPAVGSPVRGAGERAVCVEGGATRFLLGGSAGRANTPCWVKGPTRDTGLPPAPATQVPNCVSGWSQVGVRHARP
jgi:hypothetical protein